MKKLRITIAGKVYEVLVEVLEDNNHGISHPAKHVAPSPLHEPEVSAPTPTDHAVSKETGNIASPLPGRVVAISVQVGQTVKEGNQLLVLEAMKMNNYLYAPRSGRISAIHVGVGDVVEEGQSLLTLL